MNKNFYTKRPYISFSEYMNRKEKRFIQPLYVETHNKTLISPESTRRHIDLSLICNRCEDVVILHGMSFFYSFDKGIHD